MLMTKQALQDICKQHQLYRTPSLNDKLYCNFKGFSAIACLEDYTNLKALFLEGNVLESLEGLPNLPELRCLYAQQNLLWKISGLEKLENLDTLNISSNQITKLDNISCCKKLTTLIATNNKLASLESVQHLAECTSLHTIDLQNNELSDPGVLEVFKQLPNLKCLYLKGNPVVSNIKNYRKVLISSLKSLTYLDDRPVFEADRRLAEAWAAGGLDAERDERQKIKEEEAAKDQQNFDFMVQLRAAGFRERRKRLGLPEADTDPDLDNMSDAEYEFTEDPPELVAARQRLAAYTSRPGEEESADIADARSKLVSQGHAIQEGNWGSQEAIQIEGQIYFDSIKAAQAELNCWSDTKARTPAASTVAHPSSSIPTTTATVKAGRCDDDMPELEALPSDVDLDAMD